MIILRKEIAPYYSDYFATKKESQELNQRIDSLVTKQEFSNFKDGLQNNFDSLKNEMKGIENGLFSKMLVLIFALFGALAGLITVLHFIK